MLAVDGTIETWNPGAEAIKGYAPAEIVGRHFEVFYDPTDRDAGRPAHQLTEAARTGRVEDEGWRVRKDGSRFWASVVITALRDDRGTLVGFGKITRDLTARRTQEIALQEAEERFRAVFDASPIGMALLDPDLSYRRVNAALAGMLGYTVAELIELGPAAVADPSDVADRAIDATLLDELRAGTRAHYTRSKRYVRKDGARIVVQLDASVLRAADGSVAHFVGHFQDITARVEAERERAALHAALARQIELSETILRNMPSSALFLVDRDLRYASVYGPSVEALLGVPASALVGRRVDEVIPPAYRDEVLASYRATLAGVSHRLEAKRGERMYEIRSTPIAPEGGAPLALVQLYDITERIAGERERERERIRVAALMQTAPVGIFELDARGAMIYANRRLCELLGLDEHDLAGSIARRRDRLHPDDIGRVVTGYEGAIARGEPFSSEHRHVAADGAVGWTQTLLTPMRDPRGGLAGFIGTAVDITDVKLAAERASASLREKETLLKEIHHRVKNNLQIINSIVHLHASRAPDGEVRHVLEEVRGRIHAIALLHERLYASSDLGAIDLGGYARGLAADVARALGATAATVTVVADPPIFLELSRVVPLGLVLNELVTNAFKHGGGANARVGIAIATDGDTLVVEVSDGGPGFPSGVVPETSGSLGMFLVRTLARQLRATVAFTRAEARTRATLRFSRGGP